MKFQTIAGGLLATFVAVSAHAQNSTTVIQPGQPQPPPPPVVQQQPAPTVVTPAQPQPSTVVVGGGSSVRDERAYTHVPNRSLLWTGAVLFGATYLTSVAVASASPNDSDRSLLVPIIGPFIDMASRPRCVSNGCDASEAGAKVLLAGDGILQAVGVFTFVSAFIWPTKVYREDVAKVRFLPMQMGKGPSMGAGVVGTF